MHEQRICGVRVHRGKDGGWNGSVLPAALVVERRGANHPPRQLRVPATSCDHLGAYQGSTQIANGLVYPCG